MPLRLAAAHVALLVSQFKFRTRSNADILSGVVDLQIAVELAVWGAVGIWALWFAARGGIIRALGAPRMLGPALRSLSVVGLVVILASIYSPTPQLAIARAVQFVILIVLAMVTYYQLRSDEAGIAVFLTSLRRLMLLIVVIASVLTAVLGGASTSGVVAAFGEANVRYQWFSMHPITVAGILGIAIAFSAATVLATTPNQLCRRRQWHWIIAATTLAIVLLLATKARGALFGTLGAIGVLTVFSQYRKRQRLAVLVAIVVGLILFLGLGADFLEPVVLRGQTSDEFLSLTGRTEVFAAAWELFLRSPFFGFGYVAGRSLLLDVAWGAGESHSAYFELLISMGLLGVLAFGWFFLASFRVALRLQKSASVRARSFGAEAAALGVFVLLLGVIMEGFAGPVNFSTIVMAWMAILLDLAWSVASGRLRAPSSVSTFRATHT